MTGDTMALRGLLEKSSDADLLREMIGFAAERLMALEVGGLTGAGHGERSESRIFADPANPVERHTTTDQGYRICPSMVRAKSSDHPERLRLRRMEMSVRAERSTLRASLRRMARFSGPWSRRFRARSSSKVTSSTQWRLFSIRQWARTAAANCAAVMVAEAR